MKTGTHDPASAFVLSPIGHRPSPVAADIEAKEQGIKRRKNNSILDEAAALFDAQCTAFPAALNDRLTAEIANPQAAALPLPARPPDETSRRESLQTLSAAAGAQSRRPVRCPSRLSEALFLSFSDLRAPRSSGITAEAGQSSREVKLFTAAGRSACLEVEASHGESIAKARPALCQRARRPTGGRIMGSWMMDDAMRRTGHELSRILRSADANKKQKRGRAESSSVESVTVHGCRSSCIRIPGWWW